jgi:hypothetical protein
MAHRVHSIRPIDFTEHNVDNWSFPLPCERHVILCQCNYRRARHTLDVRDWLDACLSIVIAYANESTKKYTSSSGINVHKHRKSSARITYVVVATKECEEQIVCVRRRTRITSTHWFSTETSRIVKRLHCRWLFTHMRLHIHDEQHANATVHLLSIENDLSRTIKFIILLVLQPPALVCNCCLIYILLVDKNLRKNVHHHVILMLLFIAFLSNTIEIPRTLHFLRVGRRKQPSKTYCLIAQWFDYMLCAQANVLMMWASFERHLLVFHNHLFANRRRLLFNHYLPLLFLLVYVSLFYIVTIFFHPCPTNFDFASPICGHPCFTDDKILSLYDLLAHGWLPILFIVLLSTGLILRVLYPKRTLIRQPIKWRRYRRMILQMCLISSVYLVFIGPYALAEIINLFVGLSDTAIYIKEVYLFYMYWLLTLFLPFVCLKSLPEVTKQLHRHIARCLVKRCTIMPMIVSPE